MWIRAQDHKKLIDALELQIIPCHQRDFKGYCIVATSHNSLFMNKIELFILCIKILSFTSLK